LTGKYHGVRVVWCEYPSMLCVPPKVQDHTTTVGPCVGISGFGLYAAAVPLEFKIQPSFGLIKAECDAICGDFSSPFKLQAQLAHIVGKPATVNK